MKTVQISLQKAVAILRRDNSIHETYDESFKRLKNNGQTLLKTGAKLIKDSFDKKYYIGGYAADNHDVNHYFKKRRKQKCKNCC
jgi:hypothetical protein